MKTNAYKSFSFWKNDCTPFIIFLLFTTEHYSAFDYHWKFKYNAMLFVAVMWQSGVKKLCKALPLVLLIIIGKQIFSKVAQTRLKSSPFWVNFWLQNYLIASQRLLPLKRFCGCTEILISSPQPLSIDFSFVPEAHSCYQIDQLPLLRGLRGFQWLIDTSWTHEQERLKTSAGTAVSQFCSNYLQKSHLNGSADAATQISFEWS